MPQTRGHLVCWGSIVPQGMRWVRRCQPGRILLARMQLRPLIPPRSRTAAGTTRPWSILRPDRRSRWYRPVTLAGYSVCSSSLLFAASR